MDLSPLHDLVDASPLWAIGLAIGLGFLAIYLGLAGLSTWLTRRVLPRRGIGHLIDGRALAPAQIAGEIRRSLVSIAIFAVYGVITVAAERAGWIAFIWDPTPLRILGDLVLLFLWNEVHFWCCHRVLHIPLLYRRVHVVHHRSVVPTPFTTYSFHWVEATMLSSVMLLLLLVWPLDIVTIIVFPLVSLVANSIGHMNYAVFPDKGHDDLLAACQRHTAHHTRVTGNYGFYLPWIDRILGTRIRRKAP